MSTDSEDETKDPITFQIMIDPVVTDEGFTYDRKTVEEWFAKNGPLSPTTGAVLPSTKLTPNLSVRKIISRRHPDIILAPISSAQGGPAAGSPSVDSEKEAKAGNSSWMKLPSVGNWKPWTYFSSTSETDTSHHYPPPETAPSDPLPREQTLLQALSSLQHRERPAASCPPPANPDPVSAATGHAHCGGSASAAAGAVAGAAVGDGGRRETLYQLLGVGAAASEREIRDAYLREARTW
jgi:hypothetical protein